MVEDTFVLSIVLCPCLLSDRECMQVSICIHGECPNAVSRVKFSTKKRVQWIHTRNTYRHIDSHIYIYTQSTLSMGWMFLGTVKALWVGKSIIQGWHQLTRLENRQGTVNVSLEGEREKENSNPDIRKVSVALHVWYFEKLMPLGLRQRDSRWCKSPGHKRKKKERNKCHVISWQVKEVTFVLKIAGFSVFFLHYYY